jgi:diguanylate cyclase (GGDEF)-like protein
MEWQYTLFFALSPLSALIMISIMVYTWKHRYVRGGMSLTLLLFFISGWLIFNTFELVAQSQAWTIFWAKITYFFIVFSPLAWFAFTMEYTGKSKWLTPRRILLVSVLPLVTNLLIWSNTYHHLMWRDYIFSPASYFLSMYILRYGQWMVVHLVYSYLLIFMGAVAIARNFFQESPLYRSQSIWILIGVVIPIIANMVYVVRIFPGFLKDYTPLSFALASLVFTIGIFRYGLLEISPVARRVMIDQMDEGMVVLDINDRIVDVNASAKQLFRLYDINSWGVPISTLIPQWKEIVERIGTGQNQAAEYVHEEAYRNRHFDIRVTDLFDHGRRYIGRVVILHDITERVHLLEEVSQLAAMDPLTQCYNRRYFFDIAEKEWQRARRYHSPLSLAILDIDQFKKVNDSYGHLTGDRVLCEFVDFCQSNLREADLLGRFGGEEFVILFPETDLEGAMNAVNRICDGIEDLSISIEAGKTSISVTGGVVSMIDGGSLSLEELFACADKALYAAKANGERRVMAWKELNLQAALT